jgi:hypothetical protein
MSKASSNHAAAADLPRETREVQASIPRGSGRERYDVAQVARTTLPGRVSFR